MKRARRYEVSSRNSRSCCNPVGFLGTVLCRAFLLSLLFISDVPAYDFSLHGFLQGNFSANTVSDNPDGKDFKWSEERVQIKFEAFHEPLRLFVKEDAFYDNSDRNSDTKLREGYGDYTGRMWDLRAGRQIITWGVGDLLFVNDVFPKDYNAFFSGRPLEYMKKGVDSIKIGVYQGHVSMELVAIPVFEPNTLPDSRRFWIYDPMSAITKREEKKPATTWENTETALRLYRDVAGFGTSVYLYRGYFRQPSAMPDNQAAPTKLILFYPRLNVYGASLQGSTLDGVVSLETGYYESREDRNGNDPMIPNSQMEFLIGYQRQLWEDFTIGLQYYFEYMLKYYAYVNHLPARFPKDPKYYDLTSIRLTQLLVHQTLKLSFFAFYSPSTGDYFLDPEIMYNFTDHVWAVVGVNIFDGGKPWAQFGQLDKDDNIYLQVRYEF